MLIFKGKKTKKTPRQIILLGLMASLSWQTSSASAQDWQSGQEILKTSDPRQRTFKNFDQKRSMRDVIREFASDPSIYDLMKKMDEDLNSDEIEHKTKKAAAILVDDHAEHRFDRVRNSLAEDRQRKATQLLVKELGVDEYIGKGLEIDFNFFGSEALESANARNKGITYGLIVQEINPAQKKDLTADNNMIRLEDLNSAPKAEIAYKLGPKSNLDETYYIANLSSEPDDYWPSPSFKGRVSQAPGVDAAASAGNRELPPMIMGIYQEQNLYRMEYRTQSGFKKDGIYHGLSIPLRGAMSLDEEVDQSFTLIKTSAKGVLINPHAPQVDLHYLGKEGRYQSDIHLNGGSDYQVFLKAQSSSETLKEGPKYEMNVQTDF